MEASTVIGRSGAYWCGFSGSLPARRRIERFSGGQVHEVHALLMRVDWHGEVRQRDPTLRAPEDHPPAALRHAVLRGL